MNSTEKISHYQKLLKIEQEEDRVQYQENVAKRSLKEQCANGVAWFPLAMKRMYIGMAERIVMEVERTTHLGRQHVFQTGSLISLFGVENEKPIGMIHGVVQFIKGNEMKIVLNTDDFPSQITGLRMGVSLDFDDKTYKEMYSALDHLQLAKKDTRLAELREVLWGTKEPKFSKWQIPYEHQYLNQSQCRAVQKCLEAHDVAIIHGPPGTGKTTTLVQVILETVMREQQVLVCAASNTAVDLLVLKCSEKGMNVIRLGNPARVEEELQHQTLDARITQHQDYSALKKIRKEAETVRTKASKFKRNFGSEERRERKELFEEAKELQEHAKKLEEYILYQVMNQAQVIACTLAGAAHSILGKRRFSTVFIDEAGQALAPACWIPILRADRVIFAGDHLQLPPTVKSMEADRGGLSLTLFEDCMNNKNADVMLDVQYRMHQYIMQFSAKWFYEAQLKAAEMVKYRGLSPDIFPMEFVDTAGCGYEEQKNPETGSTSNPEEAQLVLRHLAILLNEIEATCPEILQPEFSIGVISPYKEQVQTLREQTWNSPFFNRYMPHLTINTVDGFQGQERDIIYISLVRSNPNGEIGFLKDTRRMNVALTRARKKLVVIGDSGTLGENKFYQHFLNYIDSIGAYKSAYEFMYDV
ncbi:MAG: AAA domain-containing protein [Bacteroidia bacterium]